VYENRIFKNKKRKQIEKTKAREWMMPLLTLCGCLIIRAFMFELYKSLLLQGRNR
jgi:hypothetical protein